MRAINTRTVRIPGRRIPFQPLKSIMTTLEQHRRQLGHLHFDHPFGHRIGRSTRLVGMYNGCRKLEQFDHLVDRACLCRPRVVHRKLYSVQAKVILPVLNSGSQDRLIRACDQYRRPEKTGSNEPVQSCWLLPMLAPEPVNLEPPL